MNQYEIAQGCSIRISTLLRGQVLWIFWTPGWSTGQFTNN